MRILHIGKYFPPFFGGMETFLQDLALALARRGLEVDLLVHDHAHRHGLRLERLGEGGRVRLHRAGTLGEWLFNPISLEFPFALGRLLRTRPPAVIHLHLPNSAAFWLLLMPAAWRIPWVVHWHADVFFERPGPLLRLAVAGYRRLEGLILRRAARIVATSPPYLEHSPALRRWRHKCEVIPLGLDPARVTADHLIPADWREGRPRVLAVGRLTFYKGFEYLIRAVQTVPEAQLVIVGEGDLRAPLQALVRELGLEGRVRLTGRQDDRQLIGWLQGCDCLCLPSVERSEAFGVVLLEAMAHAKPVVVTDVAGSGMSWVVADTISGFVVPARDVAALADALGRLERLRRGRALAALGLYGARRFQEHFHIDAVAARIEALYRRIGGNEGGA